MMDVIKGQLLTFNVIIRQDMENLSNQQHVQTFFEKLIKCMDASLIEMTHAKLENGMNTCCILNEGNMTFRSSGRYFRISLDLCCDYDKDEIKKCLRLHFSPARWSTREIPHLNPTA